MASYTAVLDRIVEAERRDGDGEQDSGERANSDGESRPDREKLAVLLLEADGEVVDERTVPVDRLPADGTHEGAVFEVEIADEDRTDEADTDDGESGALLETIYDPAAERERRERAQDRFDRLSERLSDETDDADE